MPVNKVIYSEVMQIDHLTVPYFVRQSTRAKRLQLSVRHGRIELVVPLKVKPPVVIAFLQASREWMRQQHLDLTQHTHLFWPHHFVSGETLYLEGKALTLHVKYAHQSKVVVNDRCLVVELPWSTPINQLREYSKALIIEYLKKLAQTKVREIFIPICAQLGRWPKSIQVKTQSSRWGSCGIHNEIYINWQLILSPRFVLEYVVLHECCHLFYRNHGARFWQKVATIMPNYSQAEQWLKKYGRYIIL